ncbi:hypothetical protein HDV00_008983 [Rhizophlyctis rosea]|nr:hypothetical protein HDV00_008983 [Rhizophlyctis rosea]
MASTTHPINQNWECKQRTPTTPHTEDLTSPQDWLSASVPSNIHVELLKHAKIPDPFLKQNELTVQWIGETDWLYRTSFPTPPNTSTASRAVLVFEGLDTYATVYVNGVEVLKSDNMFLEYRVDVKGALKGEGEVNEIGIVFESAYLKGKEIEEKLGVLGCWNGDASRLYVRKAQYHYGWDWGPVLLTAGPWRPVRLELFNSRIADLHAHVDVPESLTNASVTVTATIEDAAAGQQVKVELVSPSGEKVHEATVPVESDAAKLSFNVANPDLWWPHGYGAHPVYEVKVELLGAETTIETKTQKVGFRRLRLIEKPLLEQPGTTFYFEVNNVPIFCGGSNWIPADSFLTRVTPQKYRAWLQLMIDGNQRMIRVWGGGIYEEDVFYDICDDLGLLVWQDFMFGCGKYPAHPEFQASVREEAAQNVKRIRHHPSLAIFTGNNEDYQYAEQNNLEWDPKDLDGEWEKTTFPARAIYERVLPSVVKEFAPLIPYKPGSSYSEDTTDQTVGDVHQWSVWHQAQHPYQEYYRLGGRFVSEFGMQGYTSLHTIDHWLADAPTTERHPQSCTMDLHNKADGFERRIALYMVENFRHSYELEDFVYGTQLMQAEALTSAYRSWRRMWKGEGREECGGALVWQINDCWPVTSWAIVDYYLRPKAAYYAIKRELKPLTVGINRVHKKEAKDKRTRVYFDEKTIVDVWANNETLKEKEVELKVQAFELVSGKVLYEEKTAHTLLPNQATELVSTTLPEGDQVVVTALLYAKGEATPISRFTNWPEPFKYLTFPTRDSINLSITSAADHITIKADRPLKGLYFVIEGEKPSVSDEFINQEVMWEDNCIDVVPGDEQIIKAPGLEGRKVVVRYLGDRD